jgi:cyclophilin family peptidyl-prolyl cis-trans isomerase
MEDTVKRLIQNKIIIIGSCFKFCLLGYLAFIISTSASCYAQAEDLPFKLPAANKLERVRSALIETSKGSIIIELFPDAAPWHVANLKYLADRQYYQNTYVSFKDSQIAVQIGAADKTKESLLKYSLPPEFNDHKHEIGALSMARPQDGLDPTFQRRSHPAQFNIILGQAHHMNLNYTVFGRVVSGMDVVKQLDRGDLIQNLTVYVRPKPKS